MVLEQPLPGGGPDLTLHNTVQTTLRPSMVAPFAPTLARLSAGIVADKALALLASKQLRARGQPIMPSGIDAVACELSLQLLTGNVDALGIAMPRGTSGLPVLLGLYLVFQRWGRPHLYGSVLVATARGELSESLRGLTLEGAPFERMRVGKLVSRPVSGTGGRALGRTMSPPARLGVMRSLDRSTLCKLSQHDGHLLFARLGAIPPPASGVIGSAVVDTVSAARPARGHMTDPGSPDPWTLTYNTLVQAGSKQLWVGELGDPDFEAFCAGRHIPVVRITWPLAQQATQLQPFGFGGKLLSSSGICERACARPPLAFQLVHDAQRDELAREAYTLLGKMRTRVEVSDWPEAARSAYRLLALTSRLACSLETYERAAAIGSPLFNRSARKLLTDIERASRGSFHGAWGDAYDRYWQTFVGIMRRLAKHAEGEPAKMHALFDVIVAAQAAGRKLVVRCQTETERRALREALEELEAEAGVEIVTFGRRAAAGPADAPRLTLLLSPPPPWYSAVLLSAEAGSVEAFVYGYELPKLREAVSESERTYDDDHANARALDALNVPKATSNDWRAHVVELLVERPAYGEAKEWTDTEADVKIPDRNREELWRELVDLWGSELPELEIVGGDLSSTEGYGGFARLVQFLNAPPVLMRDDKSVDVIAGVDGDGLDDVVSKLPGELAAGEHIAFLPGTEHHSLREALMSAWDETLAMERQLFEPLWRAATTDAVKRHGLADLARRVGRHEATVRSWYEDRAAPQKSDDFQAVLVASGNPAAWKARAPIWRFLQTTRTMHRIIGKKLRAAIGEALEDSHDQPNIRELERITGAPVADLLDAAEELIVASVSQAVAVPLAECGRYLSADYPLLKDSA